MVFDKRSVTDLPSPVGRGVGGEGFTHLPFILSLLLFFLTAGIALAQENHEWIVGPGGDAATITEALELADDGDRIIVSSGTYTDTPIVVEKQVELIGEGDPILDGEFRESILMVLSPGVTVRGFTLRNSGMSYVTDHAAIRMQDSGDCRIENNRIENSFFAIFLAQASGCVVSDNEIIGESVSESSSGNGIHLWNTSDTVIERNAVRGHRDGIYLEFAGEVTIRDNVSTNNLRYGLHYMFSNDSSYDNNFLSENGAGVAVMYSRNVVMRGNTFENNQGTASYGLLLKDVKDAEVTGNHFRNNTVAIHSDGSDRILFSGNRIEFNGWAVKIMASSIGNTFTENAFVENTFDVVTNSRRSENSFNSNFWSRYNGYDLDRDGIGDTPYRPVRLFSFIVETRPIAVILLRSFFVDLLDLAERVLPVLTPETLVDETPLMNDVI